MNKIKSDFQKVVKYDQHMEELATSSMQLIND